MNTSKLAFFALLIAISFIFIGCSSMGGMRHEHLMKGQVLEVKGNEAYICIGSAEGAKAGQEFPVYRYVKHAEDVLREKRLSFKREQVGTIKISRVVDQHFAWASIVKGNVKENDSAEVSP